MHEIAPVPPQLSVQEPFASAPLLVSGTDAYRGGEYIYQDYLFDDRGADTVPGPGSRFEEGRNAASPTAGDVAYPPGEHYAGNAADLVEFRVKPTADDLVYRVTLNTVRDPDTAVVAIAIDTDRAAEGQVDWPYGAGVSSPGPDRFITAWGTGGSVTEPGGGAFALPDGAVSIDTSTNQMTIRVSRALMDPAGSTWRYVLGAGLWDGDGWRQVDGAPAVFNLGFRFDEPQSKNPVEPYTTFPGVGNWYEDKQAHLLSQGTTGDLHADVDFARLANGPDGWQHGPGRTQARILASRFEPFEGVRQAFPGYGTRLQPYVLHLPPGHEGAAALPVTLALHAGNSGYTQFAVNNPNLYTQLGDERGSAVVTPFGRAPNTTYTGAGEADALEALADAARHAGLDLNRVAISGYSMGGYGAYRLGVRYPDLFGRGFTAVGLPGNQGWAPPLPPLPGGEVSNTNPLLENLRWVPYMQWAQAVDELNPYTGARAQAERLNSLGLRNRFWTFSTGDHFALALADDWTGAGGWLGDAVVKRHPSRIDFAFMPQADDPDYGLISDHAYWLSGLRARETAGDPRTAPARALVRATSMAFGEGDPVTATVRTPGAGPPGPTLIEGTDWADLPPVPPANQLRLSLTNVRAAHIDGPAARLSAERRLCVAMTTDGTSRVRVALPLSSAAKATRVSDCASTTGTAAPEVKVDRAGLTVDVEGGSHTFVVRVPDRARP